MITVDQAGSIAPSEGSYGWDSRGAAVTYESADGKVSGSLGTLWFEDDDGTSRNFQWDRWGQVFPESWNRRVADMIIRSSPDSKVKQIREAFRNSMKICCTWMIAIGTKSAKAEGKLYKTLRTDGTLRVSYDRDLRQLSPPERIFTGNEMFDSLSSILKGQTWGSGTLQTFRERNPYRYTIRINSYDVRVYATNCVKCAKKGLRDKGAECPHVKKGTFFCVEVPIVNAGNEYTGEKSFAWEGQSVSYAEKNYPGYNRNPAGDDSSKVLGSVIGNIISPTGDSTLFLSYTAVNAQEQEDDEEEEHGGESEEYVRKDTVTATDTYPTASGVIASHIFSVQDAVPSTEDLYINAITKNCLYDFNASVVTGRYPVKVSVVFPYELRWTVTSVAAGPGGSVVAVTIPYSLAGSVVKNVTVYRDYSYIHINAFAYYGLNGVTVSNPAMNPKTVYIGAGEAGVSVPLCSAPVSYGSGQPNIGDNIDYPEAYTGTVTAPKRVYSAAGAPPPVPTYTSAEAKSVAESNTGLMRCRNDELVFAGRNVHGVSGWHDYSGREAPDTAVLSGALYTLNSERVYGSRYLSIPAVMRNGRYMSSAEVHYSPIILFESKGINYPGDFPVNDVRVHTPVVSDLIITECDQERPNRMYSEEIGLIADRYDMLLNIGRCSDGGAAGHENDSSDFCLKVSNKGVHRVYADILGDTYDYFYNSSGRNGGCYVLRNEVCFPFDVLLDNGDNRKESDDLLIKAGEWLSVGNRTYRFYLPKWVREGDYCIVSRTYAVNSISSDIDSEAHANGSDKNYIATDEIAVHVSGKLYGCRLTDVNSKEEWQEVFTRKKWGDICFRTGLSNELGYEHLYNRAYILPMLDGCHPNPERENTGQLKAGYTWSFDINTTGQVMGEEGAYIRVIPVFHDMKGRKVDVYYRETFDDVGHEYLKAGSPKDSKNHVFTSENELATYVQTDVLKPSATDIGEQTWSFKYTLPADILLRYEDGTPAGNVLVVGFEITAFDSRGKDYLSYNSAKSICNMWSIEGQQLNRTDYYNNAYSFEFGDVLYLDTGRSKREDYVTDRRR